MNKIKLKCSERSNAEIKVREQNNQTRSIITSESVNIGHPDKTCDVIADTFLDEALRSDPNSQMAVECAIKNDKLIMMELQNKFLKTLVIKMISRLSKK